MEEGVRIRRERSRDRDERGGVGEAGLSRLLIRLVAATLQLSADYKHCHEVTMLPALPLTYSYSPSLSLSFSPPAHTSLLLLCDFCSLPFVWPLNNVISSVKFYSIHSLPCARVAHFIAEQRERYKEGSEGAECVKGNEKKTHTHTHTRSFFHILFIAFLFSFLCKTFAAVCQSCCRLLFQRTDIANCF